MFRIDPLPSLTGTGLGTIAMGIQQQIIKANTNLPATLDKYTGLLHRSLALIQQLHDSLAQMVWITV